MVRRKSKVSLNTGLIINGILANAIVKQVPPLVNKVIAIPASLGTLVGTAIAAGAGYFMGSNELFNLGIASGASVYVNQALNMVTGGTADTGLTLTPVVSISPANKTQNAIADYLRLSEYSNSPLVNKNYFEQYAYN